MPDSSPQMHGPAASAPQTSGKVARCKVCQTQWQVRGDSDKLGCSFCGADDTAISIKREDE